MESLEQRRMLAAAPMALVGDALTLSGTAATDNYIVKLGPDGTLCIWQNVLVIDPPTYTWSPGVVKTISVYGYGEKDSLFVDFSNGSPIPDGGISFDGGDGEDWIVLSGTSADDDLTADDTQVLIGSGRLQYANNEHIDIQAGDTGDVRLRSLNVRGQARINIAPRSNVLRTGGLIIDPGATLDLNDNDMILTPSDNAASPTAGEVGQLVRQGMGQQEARDGPGLTSSAVRYDPRGAVSTLAVMANNDGTGNPILTSFDHVPVNGDAILVKYTLQGDANLDGRIDADDYFRIDQGLLRGLTGFRGGDFNYDGQIDADDYALIDKGYIHQRPRLPTVPQRIRIGPARLIETFNNPADWTVKYATLSADPQHSATESTPGLKLTWTTAGSEADLVKKLPTPIDLSDCHAVFRYYVPPESRGQLKAIFFYAGNYATGSAQVSWHAEVPVVGWNVIPFIPEDSGLLGGFKLGHPDLTKVDMLRVQIQANPGAMPTATLGSMEWYPRTTRSLVMHFIDDGTLAGYPEAVYWHSKGLRVQIPIIPSKVGQPGYMTLDQLKELQGMGHLIVNHTYSHPMNWNLLSLSQKVREIDAAAQWMESHGFGEGARVVVVPRIPAEHEVDNKLIGTYVSVMREQEGPPNNLIDTAFLRLNAASFDKFVQVLRLSEQAHGMYVSLTHGASMGEDANSLKLKAYIDTLAADQAARLVEMVTSADLLQMKPGLLD